MALVVLLFLVWLTATGRLGLYLRLATSPNNASAQDNNDE